MRAMQARLDEIAPETDALEAKIKLINEATEAADSLPTDMEELRKARGQIESLSTESATTQGKIKQRWDEIEKLLGTMSEKSVEADKLVKQTEEAYRVATSIGLAGAFDQRSKSLSWSMRWWVAGLMVALAGGTAIGANRVRILTEALVPVRRTGDHLAPHHLVHRQRGCAIVVRVAGDQADWAALPACRGLRLQGVRCQGLRGLPAGGCSYR